MSDVKKKIGHLSRQKLALLSEKLKGRSVEAPRRAIGRRPDPFAPCRLSFAQQRLWFLDQLMPNNPFYNIPGRINLDGKLEIEVLERVINEIIRRHETLRTRIEAEEGEPMQVVNRWEPLTLDVLDLTKLTREEREEETRKVAREEAETGFDLRRGPLLRVKVLKLEEDRYVALYTMHHIVSDARSVENLNREVRALYQAYSAGEESPLEELPIQYADYAIWQRGYLAGGILEGEVRYWKEQLQDVGIMNLPTDHPRPAALSYRGGAVRVEIGRESSEGLRRLGQREGATLFMTLMAAFKLILMRYSGEEDVVVGTVIANRAQKEVEGLIGFFVNTLVMRTNLGGNPSFRELIKREREVALGAYAHQELPFEKLVEEINPDRDLSRSPLFQALMTLESARRADVEIREQERDGIREETRSAKFDLTLGLKEIKDSIVGSLVCSRDLYQEETIRRMARHYEKALEEVVKDPDRPISEVDLMSASEREQMLVKWNETEAEYPRDRSIQELFEEQVERRPESMAVVYEEQELSYRELNRRANQLGHYLRRLGVGPESRVGLYLERSLEMVIGLLGILKAGGAYVPLDPGYPEERLVFMLQDAQANVLLADGRLKQPWPFDANQVIELDGEWEQIAQESGENLGSQFDSRNLAYVMYTSGSTGIPKGIMVTHQAITRLVVNTDYVQLQETDRIAQVANTSFDAATFEVWGALLNGASLVLIDQPTALSPKGLSKKLSDEKITVMFLTTALFNQIARDAKGAFSRLRYLLFGGEAVDPQWPGSVLIEGAPENLLHVYGPTEATTFTSWFLVKEIERGAVTIPIGGPIANTRVYVLDRSLQPAPVGVRGELYISGDGVARGYLERPELTAERFIPHPYSEAGGERLYRTGDLVKYLSDGNIEFIGRADDQVKVRGYRIELGEIEAVLNEHGSVRQSVVVAIDDERGGKRLLGYVVGEETTPAELKRYIRERLPEYMTPEAIVMLEAMPVTANGKIDRKRLPALSDARPSMEGNFVAPRDVLELQLAQIWERVLNIRPIGVTDNFFDLGGHSLLAVSLMSAIRSVVVRELPLSALFQGGTIERLAAILRRDASSMAWSCLVELQASGSQPPLFFVHPGGGNVLCYWDLARCLGPDQPFYGFQAPGLYGERVPYKRIEDLAAHYLEAMKAIQPQGPYLLGGWSFGGIVAYEMAQQLISQGQWVSQLIMLDSNAPLSRQDVEEVEEYIEEDEEQDDALYLIRLLGEDLPISMEELDPFEGDKRIDYVLRRAMGANLIPPDVDVVRARSFLNVHRSNGRAMGKYVPQVYPGTVTLFKTETQIPMPTSDEPALSEHIAEMIQDPTMGWGNLAAGGAKVLDVPGDHLTMVRRPHVEILALLIRECLNEVQASRA